VELCYSMPHLLQDCPISLFHEPQMIPVNNPHRRAVPHVRLKPLPHSAIEAEYGVVGADLLSLTQFQPVTNQRRRIRREGDPQSSQSW
jgi:hypothetical protein